MNLLTLRGLCGTLVIAAMSGCGSNPIFQPSPSPTPSPVVFDVQYTASTPASGGTLDLSAPNETPVALSVTFSVSVPPGQGGTYYWTTAIQAMQPPAAGVVVPVVRNKPLQPMTLAAGTQSVTISEFYTTNAVCYTPADRPASSLSLDIQLKTVQSYDAPAVFGKQYPVTFSLRCR